MPLRNRVWPDGRIVAEAARGTVMGNRGGRIHDVETKEIIREQASRRWICCVLSFKGRRRQVMGQGYTELFFVDEVTALAAGHRPCFECRRDAARAYAGAIAEALDFKCSPGADEMDRRLAPERGRGWSGERMTDLSGCPDGTVFSQDGEFFALYNKGLLRWTPAGYVAAGIMPAGGPFHVLTPSLSRAALGAGYQPIWHPSARDASAL